MPELSDVKHENFAILVAYGAPARVAYLDSGFESKPENAGRNASDLLRRNPQIKARIEELRKDRETVMVEGLQDMTAWVLEQLVMNYRRCASLEDITYTNHKGEIETRRYFEPSVVNKSLELIGKQHGMFKEQVLHTGKITLEELVANSRQKPEEA